MARWWFDQEDHELLSIVNEVLGRARSRKYLKNLLLPYLHPNGIKEMAATKELRIAYAVINLLDILRHGETSERLIALRAVRDEVLHCAHSRLRINTGRVLLQIMKEILRAHGQYDRQLMLAHDFRSVSSGKPRLVREQLKKYHLLEMPEEWNQVTFDHHVHDANTKGRKSATHLIMDAWIKGIRSLTVVYYNFVNRESAAELLEAAEIMGITARVGVEFTTRLEDSPVHFIWLPSGFSGAQDFLHFLDEPEVRRLMDQGRDISKYQEARIVKILEAFNQTQREALAQDYGLNLEPLVTEEFLGFVGSGQASLLHLAVFVHQALVPVMAARVQELRDNPADGLSDRDNRRRLEFDQLNALTSEQVLARYIAPLTKSTENGATEEVRPVPELAPVMKSSARELMSALSHLHAGCKISLNLSNLMPEDVLELLFQCEGLVTHLEIFNLKDFLTGKSAHLEEIGQLKDAINTGNVIRLKKLVQAMIDRLEYTSETGFADRIERLTRILHQAGRLPEFYRKAPLRSFMGSDSTGRSAKLPGMGLAVKETLPRRAQNELMKQSLQPTKRLPVRRSVFLRDTWVPTQSANPRVNSFWGWLNRTDLFLFLGKDRKRDWVSGQEEIRLDQHGNVFSLSGPRGADTNGWFWDAGDPPSSKKQRSWRYLNGGLKNSLKVFLGFIPAFLTFALTKDWWLLAYFGAVIWFGITGVRNIIQSILAGRGLKGSPMLRWKDYVSWERLADSLFFTGFSVPLLDLVVKTIILDHAMGITTATHPIWLYSVMALANGCYLSGHNAWRGLPRAAIFANFFRSVLSIPLAVLFNFTIGEFLIWGGVGAVDAVLQKWAAIISKGASDCMAGIIEGTADRFDNIRRRVWDYGGKLALVFDTFNRLELLFPENDVLDLMDSPKTFFRVLKSKDMDLEKIVIVNSLDLMFFWMYQPQARQVLRNMLKGQAPEERTILVQSQKVLERHREVSQMFVDGLVGKKFARPLAFYLDRFEQYRDDMARLLETNGPFQNTVPSPVVPVAGGPVLALTEFPVKTSSSEPENSTDGPRTRRTKGDPKEAGKEEDGSGKMDGDPRVGL